MAGVLMRRGEETQRHMQGRRPCEDGGRDLRDAVWSIRKLEEAREYSLLEPLEGARPR